MLARTLRRAALAHRARRYRRRVDPDAVRWMHAQLRPGDLAIDVGAHEGAYTYLMWRAVGDTGVWSPSSLSPSWPLTYGGVSPTSNGRTSGSSSVGFRPLLAGARSGGRLTLRLLRPPSAEHRPRVLVECEARHAPGRRVEDVFGHLEEFGYRGSFFWRGERLEVARFDVASHQVEGRLPCANNFIFELTGA